MPAWISIVYRVILTIRIQVKCIRLGSFSSVCILGQESGVLWGVETCVVVIQSAALVIDLACVADLVVDTCSASQFCVPEIIIFVSGCCAAVFPYDAGGAFPYIFVVEIPVLAVSGSSRCGYDIGADSQKVHGASVSVSIFRVQHCSVLIEIVGLCLRFIHRNLSLG